MSSFVRPAALADAPYAYASIVPPDRRLVFLAGSCPLDAAGRIVAPGDLAAQTRVCLSNMTTVLAEMGAALTDVVSTRVLVATTDRADLGAAWDVYASVLGEHDVPSTLMGVTVLGYPDQLVEIDAVAAVASERTVSTGG